MRSDWLATLQQQAAEHAPLAVAFSGGLDSTVLLHVLAKAAGLRERGLRALHVDHRLQPASAHWAQRCAELCRGWDVPFESLAVDVRLDGHGLEAAAREARYAALLGNLREGETLVLAQHRDDQAETVLLRLLRGAGSGGLAAMREFGKRADARLWRPLLAVPRVSLRDYAGQHRLEWIDDPSNADPRHLRNHLRHEVLPRLRARWPQADAALAASAALLAEDAELIDGTVAPALAAARGLDPRTLSLRALRALAPALQRHVLRRWLHDCGLPAPPASILQRVLPELAAAAPDREPRLCWGSAELIRYRDLLYCSLAVPPGNPDWQLSWNGSTALRLPGEFGRLELTPAPLALGPMRVTPRVGGEQIRLPRQRLHRLKQVLQAIGIPPWERRRLPLLFAADGELLAAGDLAISARLDALLLEHGRSLRWWPGAAD